MNIGVEHRRIWATRLLGGLVFILMTLAAASFPYVERVPADMVRGTLLALFATLLLAVVLWLANTITHTPLVPRERERPPLARGNWFLAGLGTLCMLILAETGGNVAGIEALEAASPHLQFALLVSGCVLLVWGLGGGGRPYFIRQTLGHMQPHHWHEVGLLVALTALAFAVRVYRLEGGFRYFVDELNFALFMPIFEATGQFDILSPFVRQFPATYSYIQFIATRIFGDGLFGLRIISVVFGALTVPVTYLLARFLFDRPTAMAAGLIMVTFPVHVHFSRIGLNNIADPLFGTAALAFLVAGMRYNQRFAFAVAGVCLGLTQYFYEVGRLLYPLAVALWCGWGMLTGYARPYWRGLLLAAGAAALVAMPIYATFYGEDASLIPRVEEQANLGEADEVEGVLAQVGFNDDYLRGLSQTARVYINEPEGVHPYYGGAYGYVLPLMLPFFFLGIAFVMIRFWQMPIILVLTVVLVSFATSLIEKNVIAARFVMTHPALVVLVAVGLRVVVGVLVANWHLLRSQRVMRRAVVVLALAIGLFQGLYYHSAHLVTFNYHFKGYFAYDAEDAIMRATTVDPPHQVHILTIGTVDDVKLNSIMTYFRPAHRGITVWKRETFSPWHMEWEWPTLFFVPIDDEYMIDILRWGYVVQEPERSPEAHYIPDDRELLMIRAAQPLHGPYVPLWAGDDWGEVIPSHSMRGRTCVFDSNWWNLHRTVCMDAHHAQGLYGRWAWEGRFADEAIVGAR